MATFDKYETSETTTTTTTCCCCSHHYHQPQKQSISNSSFLTSNCSDFALVFALCVITKKSASSHCWCNASYFFSQLAFPYSERRRHVYMTLLEPEPFTHDRPNGCCCCFQFVFSATNARTNYQAKAARVMAPTHGVCFSLQRKYYDLLWQVECCSARAGAGQRVNPISLALSRFLWQHIGADDCSRPPTSPTHTTDTVCAQNLFAWISLEWNHRLGWLTD